MCCLHSSLQNSIQITMFSLHIEIHNGVQIHVLIDVLIVLHIPLREVIHSTIRIHVMIDLLIVLHIAVRKGVHSTVRIHTLIDIHIVCYRLLHILPYVFTYYCTDYNTDSATNWTYSIPTDYLFNTDCLTHRLNFADFHTD